MLRAPGDGLENVSGQGPGSVISGLDDCSWSWSQSFLVLIIGPDPGPILILVPVTKLLLVLGLGPSPSVWLRLLVIRVTHTQIHTQKIFEKKVYKRLIYLV